MNTIKIKQVNPGSDYNTVFTFSKKLLGRYNHLRQYFAEELATGKEEFDGTSYIWKMNLSQTKIDMVIGALKKVFQEMEDAHGFTEEIVPGQPRIQSLTK